ncbi:MULTISPECIES: hypothetical protein [unclassified Isoptericola]|uniref:hypothetical protein n=1 Tax=unclassified Isoptericola TaxID=2623355 RepID=UPI002713C514|nr:MULTISPECIES: hypothetical protein [unclassified Isoptericola]MDO8146943.1 hypothetical protein [Isoptericola sp. b515]MDO8150742.1 hypothetical protein [Isoptericola sp. b408]
MTNLWEFFTNKSEEAKGDAVVEGNAFSLTKVLVVLVPVVTSVGTWAVNQLREVEFSSGQITAMVIAVIAFVAVAVAADVLARAVATSAERMAGGRLHVVNLKTPIQGRLENTGRDEKVSVIAIADADPLEYLVLHTGSDGSRTATLEPFDKVELGVN